MGRKAPRKAPDTPRYGVSNGCLARTRTFLGAPPTPRFGVSEAKMQNPGRKMRRGNEKGCLNRGNGMTNGAVGIVCPGCDAARAAAKRCVADPGPPRTGTVPGLQRIIIALRFMLRCARDTRGASTCGCTKSRPGQFSLFRIDINNENCNSNVFGRRAHVSPHMSPAMWHHASSSHMSPFVVIMCRRHNVSSS
jgi:hypothetical protein